MSRVIDISLPISERLLTWPGDPSPSVVPSARIADGDEANVSRLSLGSHAGTHVDPPSHFIDGAAGADALPLDVLCGECYVADARGHAGPLERDDLERLHIPLGTRRLLVKSDSSDLWRQEHPEFPERYTCIGPTGAEWLVERGVRLIGIDFLSIEAKDAPGHPVHHTLLGNGVVVVEGLDLGAVDAGTYRLVCLPLRVADGDGAPARAALIADYSSSGS